MTRFLRYRAGVRRNSNWHTLCQYDRSDNDHCSGGQSAPGILPVKARIGAARGGIRRPAPCALGSAREIIMPEGGRAITNARALAGEALNCRHRAGRRAPEANIVFDAAADGYSAVRSLAAIKAKRPGAGAPGQTSPG